ncbi:hypothetical protein ACVRWB_05080 [Streptococcus troglodytae]|uniref:Proton-translocating NADH-quinone oxidoreductase, chain M n=1 Tax=Streptococcus troglodytae TaxID=1111760 RepID=A0A1L7LLE2_9STRE|nr:hypothetical protein [Streptococcus troglodytae]BAQ25017.1 proton-translocating NADH-quinone oxidoreductase, chain M precursor [Streptococcus troglodytae]
MKNPAYKRIPFAIALPQLFAIWLISADSHPVWIKHVTFGITMALIFLIFIIVNTATFPDKPAKSDVKRAPQQKLEFRWTYLIPSLSVIPIMIANVAVSSNPVSFKLAVLGITFSLIALVFAITVWLMNRHKES